MLYTNYNIYPYYTFSLYKYMHYTYAIWYFLIVYTHTSCTKGCKHSCSLPWENPWDFPGKNTGVGYHFLYIYVHAAAKSLQSCPTLCDPVDGSPPGSSIPGIIQARTLEWVAISFSMHESEKWKWSCSVVSDS